MGNSKKSKDRRIKDIYAVSEEEEKRLKRLGKSLKDLKRIEQIILPLVELKMKNQALFGTRLRQEAAEELNCSTATIDRLVSQYIEDPRIESLIGKKRGRSEGRMLSEEQQDIACALFLDPKTNILYPDGIRDKIPQISTPQDIYEIIQMVCPEPKWSIHTLRRYLHDLERQNPLVIERAHKGASYLRKHRLPAMRNDVERPGQRIQLDGRTLPIFVNYEGMICTVVVLVALDDFSWFPVRHRLIPRFMKDDEGFPKRADFTSGDVGILMASAMYYENFQSESFYTDNGGQIIATERFFDELNDLNEALTKMTNSMPGYPRGRGKIEKFLGLLDEFIKNLAANFVGKENDRQARKEAREAPNMLTFKKFCEAFDKHIDYLRKQPRNKREKTGRNEIWKSAPTLPAPPIRRLYALTPNRITTHVSISKWQIVFQKQSYEPVVKTVEDMYRWMVAAAQEESIPLYAIELDTGWVLEVSLDGEHWNECVLKTEQHIGIQQYSELHRGALKLVEERHKDLLDRIKDTAQRFELDHVYKDVISGKPMLLNGENKPISTPLPEDPNTASPRKPRIKHGRSPSLSQRESASPSIPPSMPNKWAETPTVADLLRQLDEEENG